MSTELLIGKKGYIINYRRSRHVIHPQFAILQFPGFESRADAAKLIGKVVGWETQTGKMIRGKITRIHGNSGEVAANFRDGGLPGQSFGTLITIIK